MVTDLIGTRLYPGWFPEKVVYPAVAYLEVSGVRHHDIDVGFPRVQFSVFSAKYTEAKAVAAAIRNELRRYSGQMGEYRVIQIVAENEYEQYERDTKLYHVALDLKIIYREA